MKAKTTAIIAMTISMISAAALAAANSSAAAPAARQPSAATPMSSAAASAASKEAEKKAKEAAKAAEKKVAEEFNALKKTQRELAGKDFKGGLATYWQKNSEEAIANWREALKDPKWTNAQRLEMLASIADILLQVPHDEKQAEAVMEEGLKLPGLDEAGLLDAKKRLAGLRLRMHRPTAADIDLCKSLAKDEKQSPGSRAEAVRSVVQMLALKDKKAAWGYLNGCKGMYGVDVVDFAEKYGLGSGEFKREFDAAKAERLADYKKMLAAYDGKKGLDGREFQRVMVADWTSRGIAALKAEFPAVAKAIVAKNQDKVKNAPSRWLWDAYNAVPWNVRSAFDHFSLDAEGRRYAYEMLSDKSLGDSMPGDIALMRYLNRVKETKPLAVAYAEKIIADSKKEGAKVDKKALREATEIVAFKGAESDVKKTIAAIKTMLEYDGKAEDKAEFAKRLGEKTAEANKRGDEKTARALLAEYRKVVPEKPQSRLDCPYWKDAPRTLAGVIESDFYKKAEKGLLSHHYGDNLQFLIETDSALMGREMTTFKGEKFRPTEIFAFFDDAGVKIVLRSYEDTEKIRAGFAGPAGYESYLAPGVEAPYWCYMFSPREDAGDMSDGFVTQYANDTGHRVAWAKDRTFKNTSVYLDDGVATMLEISWGAAFLYTPDREKAWFFEPLHWAHGGMSWGGSKSVHHRSSFGALEFKGCDKAALTAIRRRLLPQAKRAFEKECSSRNNGHLERWEDPELGDQEFYLAKVKPFKVRLQAALKGVKYDMTDDEVNSIYETAAFDAFNTDYILARMRREWLEEKRVKGE